MILLLYGEEWHRGSPHTKGEAEIVTTVMTVEIMMAETTDVRESAVSAKSIVSRSIAEMTAQ